MPGKFRKYLLLTALTAYIAVSLVWWIKLPNEPVMINIPPGSSAHYVAGKLEQAGIVKSARIFLFCAKLTGNIKKLKAGNYEIYPKNSVFKVIDILSKGKSKYVKVTIPEGFTNMQIGERLQELGIVSKEAFLALAAKDNLEGYLFPETYYFEAGMPETKVAKAMLEQFNIHFSSSMRQRANSIKGMNEKNIVILASIIEKEAVVSSERPLIAAVFYNRLKKRMYLESCATVLYAIGKHKENLTFADLKTESPYNTYRHYGLPLGPICNPGIDSINAALYPAESEELYFVATGTGTHNFSRYFSEHLKEKMARKKRK